MFILAILSGIFIGTSYIPLPPWAYLFCFVPLWIFWLREERLSRVFIGGWITQFILTLIGFNWVAHTIHEFGHMPWPLAAGGLIAFCAFANIDVAIAGVLQHLIRKKIFGREISPVASITVMAIATTLVKNSFETIFHWSYGYPLLWIHLPMAQLAELIGFSGLSSIVILFNIGAFYFWQHRRDRRGRLALLLIVGLLAALNGAGYILQQTWEKPDSELNVLITQANISNLEKEYAERGWGFREQITEVYSDLTRRAKIEADQNGQPIDFIVWPETAYPYEVDQRFWVRVEQYPFSAKPLFRLTEELQTPLITGGYGFAPRDGVISNTFFIVEKDHKIEPDPYYKTLLLAFGEYIPFGEIWPVLYKWIPAAHFSIGLGPAAKKINIEKSGVTEELKVGPQICYEGLFASFSRELAMQGAEIFVNLTNDSWYGTWQEPYQHLYNTVGRAIEFRRPLVRSTNTGISTVVTALGEVGEFSPMNTKWTHVFKIPYKRAPSATFYQKCPWLMSALLIISLLWIGYRAKRKA